MSVFWVLLLVAVASAYDTTTDTSSVEEPQQPQQDNPMAQLHKSVIDVFAVNPSNQQTYNVPDVYQKPVFIAIPSSNNNSVVLYFADNGIGSVADIENFSPLVKIFNSHDHVSGVILNYNAIEGKQFLDYSISKIVLPDGYKFMDFLQDVHIGLYPVVYFAPGKTFGKEHFVRLTLVYKFVIEGSYIEPVPAKYPYYYYAIN